MNLRSHCQIPWCDVEVDEKLCAGHIYLKEVDKRKTDEFAKASLELLARIKEKANV